MSNIADKYNKEWLQLGNENFESSAIIGRTVTAKLRVSPNGDNSDGSSWEKAFTTLQGALAAASSDANDLTLILIAPHATNYDIDTTGDPTYTGNYEICGSHRNWAKIKNDHSSATSIMKFTGKVSLCNLTFDCGVGTNNGVIINGSDTKGFRIDRVYFECENVTGAQTALEISDTEHVRLRNMMVHGVQANTKGLLLDNMTLSNLDCMQFHDCIIGIQFINNSDDNSFKNILYHDNTLALDIDSGSVQIFEDLQFFNCTTNTDDEVGDHQWTALKGEFPISNEPDDFTGVAVDTGDGADTWTAADVEVRAAVTSTIPFRIIGVSLEAGSSEKYRIRLSADGGSTYFTDFQFEGVALGANSSSLNFPSGTSFIFNKGTQIVASSKSEGESVDELDVWLEIQEI